MKNAKKLKQLRILSQTAFFVVFLFVFIRSLDPFWYGENPFLRYDPLIFLTHLKPGIKYILPIAGILILTILIGRFFCGWVCPLGSLIDLLDFGMKPLRKLNPLEKRVIGFERKLINLPPSWFLLGAVLPTLFFIPPVLQFLHPNIWIIRIFSLSNLGLYFLALIIVLSAHSRRFWCTMICPLGGLYGLIASLKTLQLQIIKCSGCKLCETCPMKAAHYKTKTIFLHQCNLCFEFEANCPVNGFVYSQTSREREPIPNEMRRLILKQGGIIAGGILVGFLLSVIDNSITPFFGSNHSESGDFETDLIRPPGVSGVSSEAKFVQRCLRCFQCVRSCPNQIIKITGPGHGFDNLFTPHVRFGEFGCDYNCQVCQLVCPNYAIPLQTLDEKKKTKMGIAKIDEKICVVFAKNVNCLVCEEVCPVPQKAIKIRDELKLVNGSEILLRYPVLDRNLCIGCGICEAKCPTDPKSIIVRRI